MKDFDEDDSVELDSVISDEKERETLRVSVHASQKFQWALSNEQLTASLINDTDLFDITEQIEEMQKTTGMVISTSLYPAFWHKFPLNYWLLI